MIFAIWFHFIFIFIWHAKIMWCIISAASILSRVTRTWPRPVVSSSPAFDTFTVARPLWIGIYVTYLSLCLFCHAIYTLELPWIALPYCPLPPTPTPFLCSWKVTPYLLRIANLWFQVMVAHDTYTKITIGKVTAYLSMLFTGNWHREPSLF